MITLTTTPDLLDNPFVTTEGMSLFWPNTNANTESTENDDSGNIILHYADAGILQKKKKKCRAVKPLAFHMQKTHYAVVPDTI